MRVLVINRANNFGDTLCQMRGLKEYKDKHPDDELHFVSSEYLHVLAASHTDLFKTIRMDSFANLAKPQPYYDQVIEFEIDWGNALRNGILRAWTEKTLGFIPSTDKPLFEVRHEEKMIAFHHAKKLQQRFDKLVMVQLEAPSGYVRSYKYEDWEKVLNYFPEDVGLIYTGPIDMAFNEKLKPRKNLILLPAYDLGVTAALMEYVDFCFFTHGGMAMLAHSQDKKEVIHTIFTESGSPKILWVPSWNNLVFPTHKDVEWIKVEQAIKSALR